MSWVEVVYRASGSPFSPLLGECNSFFTDVAPRYYGRYVNEENLNVRLGEVARAEGLKPSASGSLPEFRLFRLWHYADDTTNTGMLSLALDRTLQRKMNSTTSIDEAQRDHWCITLGISQACMLNADQIYSLVKTHIRDKILADDPATKLGLIWHARKLAAMDDLAPAGTSKVDDVFRKMLNDSGVVLNPRPVAGDQNVVVKNEPAYGHFRPYMLESGLTPSVRFIEIQSIR